MASGDGETSGVAASTDEILVASKDTAINRRPFNSISSVIHSASFVRKQMFLSQSKLKGNITARTGKERHPSGRWPNRLPYRLLLAPTPPQGLDTIYAASFTPAGFFIPRLCENDLNSLILLNYIKLKPEKCTNLCTQISPGLQSPAFISAINLPEISCKALILPHHR